MSLKNHDSPVENRVTELCSMRRNEDSEELQFLEEYLLWKNTGGLARMDAARKVWILSEIARENRARLSRKGPKKH